jgi:curved DNA-binding protein CbpA
MMNVANDPAVDYYEILQISPNAEPETIQRVYRLLAQRVHPDNLDTGNAATFRRVCEAYQVLSDPITRAQYDAVHEQRRQDRWRLVSTGRTIENDFEVEQIVRLTVLEVLYAQRRMEPQASGIFITELETLTGRPREHLEFTVWYLVQKGFAQRTDNSRLTITALGVDHLEQNHQVHLGRPMLRAHTGTTVAVS